MSHSWVPYPGDQYWSFNHLTDWLTTTSHSFGSWVSCQEIGRSREGLPIHLLTLGDHAHQPEEKPAFWLDGGTHAAEWTGVMSCLYQSPNGANSLTRTTRLFSIGFEARSTWCHASRLMDSQRFSRATFEIITKPARGGTVRTGFDPCDVDGDGDVKWMRWKIRQVLCGR